MTETAKSDVLEIHRYVALHDSERNAERLRDAILAMCYTFDKFPGRGHFPLEFLKSGTREFREIHYKPYRIVYQTIERDVFIIGILDGRRKLDVLLKERMRRYQQQ
jgi:toxin ParE1/3/4